MKKQPRLDAFAMRTKKALVGFAKAFHTESLKNLKKSKTEQGMFHWNQHMMMRSIREAYIRSARIVDDELKVEQNGQR